MKKLLYLLSLILIISCSSNETQNTSENSEEVSSDNSSITLSDEQVVIAKIETGKIIKQKISETIECTGTIEVPPENTASVSPIIGGFIKTLNFYPGDFVKEGAVLATLQHPDFIQLQQQYLEAKSQVDYYQEEYKRQGELTVENAASIKKMQKAKADYLTSEANYKSLKAQLELLGVNPIKIEKEDFETEFKLFSPISGTVSKLNANKGLLVNPENPVYEIINDEYLFLNLNVFEKDIQKVSLGQKINFSLLNDPKKFEAKVKRIGIGIEENNRTTTVHSITEKKNSKLRPGKFVSASILINERESYTLPSEAIVTFNDESYIFIRIENTFKTVKVKPGIEKNNLYEITETNNELLNAEIVIKGTYYLSSIIEAVE
ncbi:MAG: efflux RND transporter periplasmic adaptor subunit [Bacteroidales bacterium]|nr:efflux RND transporter periplasmic adaptor subunit [Bacteroidales bacterium]